jgi:SAM-dependent methyltransferase
VPGRGDRAYRAPVEPRDPTELVRRGYDALSDKYAAAYSEETKYRAWIEDLLTRLPVAGTVVDLGCGTGVPVARALVQAGHRVTGIDLSEVQLARARERVPGAEFRQGDLTAVTFPAGSLDAVVCLYALFHVPLAEQPPALCRIAGWLRPGGLLVVTTGATAWTGTDPDWLGGGVPMWWGHADAATSRRWLTEAGFVVEHEEPVPEGDGDGHVLFRARAVGGTGDDGPVTSEGERA